MKKAFQNSLIFLAAAAQLVGPYSNVAYSNADFRPSWITGMRSLGRVQVNQSFLSDTRRNLEVMREEAFIASIMDPVRAAQLRQEYEFATREYHQQQAHGLMDPASELAWMERMDEKRRSALREVQRSRVGATRKHVRDAAVRGDISTPIIVSSTIASLYFGTPVYLQIDESTRVMAKTNFVEDRAQLQVLSNIVDGTLDLTGDSHMNREQVDPNRVEERYRFSLSRQLPVWDLSSGLSYGGTTRSLQASLAKPLSDNLTAVLDTRRPMNSSSLPAEEKVSLQYGIRF